MFCDGRVDARLAAGSTGLKAGVIVTRLKTVEGIWTVYSNREEDRRSFETETLIINTPACYLFAAANVNWRLDLC
jgi:hypothetical protein